MYVLIEAYEGAKPKLLAKRSPVTEDFVLFKGTRMRRLKVPIYTGKQSFINKNTVKVAERHLSELRIRNAVFAREFPMRKEFSFVREPDVEELLKAAAVPVIKKLLENHIGDIFISASFPTALLQKTVMMSAGCCRKLYVYCGEEAYLDVLRQKFGVSAVAYPTTAMLSGCTAAIILSDIPYPVKLPNYCIVLDVSARKRLNIAYQRKIIDIEIADDFCTNKLLEKYDMKKLLCAGNGSWIDNLEIDKIIVESM